MVINPKLALALVTLGSLLIVGSLSILIWWLISSKRNDGNDELHAKEWTSLDIDANYPSNEESSEFASWRNRASALPHKIDYFPIHTLQPLQNLPTQFYYKACDLVPVQNQGECNTCTIFACMSMLANRLALISGGDPTMLSVQQYLDCTGHPCSKPQELRKPLEFAANIGMVKAKVYPYEQKTGSKCQTSLAPQFNDRIFASKIQSISPRATFKVGDAAHLNCIERAKTEIYSFGPIVSVISIYSDLMKKYRATAYDKETKRHTGAIYSPTSGAKFIGYHAIMIIGWIQPGPGFTNACWACVSSWGSSWPASPWDNWNGLFFIQMGKNTCGIESQMITCLPIEVKLNG